MPGIYVNDGGAMSSGLGSALGRMADAFSPQAQAQAALTYQETLRAMWQNRLLQSTVPAQEQGIAAQRALPGAVNAEVGSYGYTPPTGPQSPGVAGPGAPAGYSAGGGVGGSGTSPGVGRPPPAPQGFPANTSQDTLSQGGEAYKGASNAYHSGQGGAQQHGIMADILASYAAQGKGASDVLPMISFGQSTTRGPGMSTSDQAEIARTRVAPFNQAPGEQRIDPYGQMGIPLPGQATSGPSRAIAGLSGAQPPPTQISGQPGQPGGVYDGQGQPSQQPTLRTGYMQMQPGQPVQLGQQPSQLPPGQIPGQVAPGVWQGPSLYGTAVQKGQAEADLQTFGKLAPGVQEGAKELQNISDLRRLHDLVGTGSLPGRALSAVDQEILNRTGISLGTPSAAMADINKRIAEMVGQIRDQFGSGRVSAAAMGMMKQSLPSAQMDPRTFGDVMSSLEAAARQKIDAGYIAQRWQNGQIDAPTARNAINSIYVNDPTEMIRAQHPNLFGVGPGGAAAPTGRSGFGAPTPQAAPAGPAPPPVGTVSKGYRFTGGDPSNPSSWAPVQ
jgi:hypothetical protein